MENLQSIREFPVSFQFFKSRRFLLTVLAIGIHIAVALPLAWSLNIWLDEGWTMRTTGNGLLHAWHEAIVSENQAPLYFTLIAALRSLNDSLFTARLFSVACISATIALIPALLRRFLPQDSGSAQTLLPFVVALHPYSIWASLEARVYALVILLSALLLLFWFDGYCATKNNRRAQVLYVLLAVVSLYTNYYLGFLLFANACALLTLRRWNSLGYYVGHMTAAGLFFAPLVLIVQQQFVTNSDYYRKPTTFIDGVKNIWNIFINFLLPSAEWEMTALLRVWTARAGAAALLFLAAKRLRHMPLMTVALGVIAAIISFFLMGAYFLLDETYIQIRHCAPLFIPLLLLLTALLINLAGRRGFYVWLILLLIFMPTELYSEHSQMVKNGDWRRVAEFIETNEEAGQQPITTFQLQDSIPLRFSYRGKNQILPGESIGNWRVQDRPLTSTRWLKQIELLISQIPPNQKYLWLVTDSICHNEKTSVECRPLEDFVEANYVVEKTADFHLRRVRLLRRKTTD